MRACEANYLKHNEHERCATQQFLLCEDTRVTVLLCQRGGHTEQRKVLLLGTNKGLCGEEFASRIRRQIVHVFEVRALNILFPARSTLREMPTTGARGAGARAKKTTHSSSCLDVGFCSPSRMTLNILVLASRDSLMSPVYRCVTRHRTPHQYTPVVVMSVPKAPPTYTRAHALAMPTLGKATPWDSRHKTDLNGEQRFIC